MNQIVNNPITSLPYTTTDNIVCGEEILTDSIANILKTFENIDYIIENGVDSGWSYRIWKSGWVDMWYSLKSTLKVESSTNLGQYYCSFPIIYYPERFIFSEAYEHATVVGEGNSGWLAHGPEAKQLNRIANYKLFRGTSTSTNLVIRLDIYVHGFLTDTAIPEEESIEYEEE